MSTSLESENNTRAYDECGTGYPVSKSGTQNTAYRVVQFIVILSTLLLIIGDSILYTLNRSYIDDCTDILNISLQETFDWLQYGASSLFGQKLPGINGTI